MVLAAGLGTRMRPLSDLLAKPALPVLNRPLLHWTLELLARHGVRDVLVNTHHRPETVERAVGTGRRFGLRVRYAHEPVILGSGGGPRKVRAFLGERAGPARERRLRLRLRPDAAPAPSPAVGRPGDPGPEAQPRPPPLRSRGLRSARFRALHPAAAAARAGGGLPVHGSADHPLPRSWSACPRALPTSWPRSTRRFSPRAGSSKGYGCAAAGSTSERLASIGRRRWPCCARSRGRRPAGACVAAGARRGPERASRAGPCWARAA